MSNFLPVIRVGPKISTVSQLTARRGNFQNTLKWLWYFCNVRRLGKLLPAQFYHNNSLQVVNIHLLYGPEGNSLFLFSLESSPDEVAGNIRTRRKTKLISFPRDHTLSVLLIQTFIQQKHTNKDGLRATTAQVYPGRDTFEFDQGHVTKNQPITVLICGVKVQLYNKFIYLIYDGEKRSVTVNYS